MLRKSAVLGMVICVHGLMELRSHQTPTRPLRTRRMLITRALLLTTTTFEPER